MYSYGVTGCGVEDSEDALAEDDIHSRVMGHDDCMLRTSDPGDPQEWSALGSMGRQWNVQLRLL